MRLTPAARRLVHSEVRALGIASARGACQHRAIRHETVHRAIAIALAIAARTAPPAAWSSGGGPSWPRRSVGAPQANAGRDERPHSPGCSDAYSAGGRATPVSVQVWGLSAVVARDLRHGRPDTRSPRRRVAVVVPNLPSALYSASRCRKSVALPASECPPNPATEG